MIYFVQDKAANHIKIGFTDAPDAGERLKALQTGSPAGLVLLLSIPGKKTDEADLHKRFADARTHGEWFRPVPELIQFIIVEVFRRGYDEGAEARHNEAEKEDWHDPQFFMSPDNEWAGRLHPNQVGGIYKMHCPVCCCEYVGTIDDFKHHKLSTRSGTHVVSFVGECGHAWSLCLGFHKGNTYATAVYEPSGDPTLRAYEDVRGSHDF